MRKGGSEGRREERGSEGGSEGGRTEGGMEGGRAGGRRKVGARELEVRQVEG